MIVSHRHRFIFIKTRKTAGTSIEIALSAHCGPDDIMSPISKEDEKASGKKKGTRNTPGSTKIFLNQLSGRAIFT